LLHPFLKANVDPFLEWHSMTCTHLVACIHCHYLIYSFYQLFYCIGFAIKQLTCDIWNLTSSIFLISLYNSKPFIFGIPKLKGAR
jgi:hypothetical protein